MSGTGRAMTCTDCLQSIKIQAQFDLKTKEDIVNFGLDRFAKECIKFSSEKAKLMDADLWRLGIWMDYDNAYWYYQE